MTIAIAVKVNDGLVLATDSATTFMQPGSSEPFNIYNNANKVFNLYKGAPIGAMTWGGGNIGPESIATMMKDLRQRFMTPDAAHIDWKLDRESYTVEMVATRLREYVFDELYLPAFAQAPTKPYIGFLVGGYSSTEILPETYLVEIAEGGTCAQPELIQPKDRIGPLAFGQPEAFFRIFHGVDPRIKEVLEQNLGVSKQEAEDAWKVIVGGLITQLYTGAMPIQDAIDLAEFLVDLSIKYSRFKPGSPTVGGPIEVAAITRYEGFKWIRRKHYYGRELNPEVK